MSEFPGGLVDGYGNANYYYLNIFQLQQLDTPYKIGNVLVIHEDTRITNIPKTQEELSTIATVEESGNPYQKDDERTNYYMEFKRGSLYLYVPFRVYWVRDVDGTEIVIMVFNNEISVRTKKTSFVSGPQRIFAAEPIKEMLKTVSERDPASHLGGPPILQTPERDREIQANFATQRAIENEKRISDAKLIEAFLQSETKVGSTVTDYSFLKIVDVYSERTDPKDYGGNIRTPMQVDSLKKITKFDDLEIDGNYYMQFTNVVMLGKYPLAPCIYVPFKLISKIDNNLTVLFFDGRRTVIPKLHDYALNPIYKDNILSGTDSRELIEIASGAPRRLPEGGSKKHRTKKLSKRHAKKLSKSLKKHSGGSRKKSTKRKSTKRRTTKRKSTKRKSTKRKSTKRK